jgi:hypothetical protein
LHSDDALAVHRRCTAGALDACISEGKRSGAPAAIRAVMAKRSSRRLSVKKETLRRLGEGQLGQVAGGTSFMGTGTLAGSGSTIVSDYIVASATWTKSWTCETTSLGC